MNSTLQCFRSIPEFKKGMKTYAVAPIGGQGDMQSVLCNAWGKLYQQMDSTQKPVTPFLFTESMRTLYPQLGSRDEKGNYQQQDADECLTTILSSVKRVVKNGQGVSLADELFTGTFEVTL